MSRFDVKEKFAGKKGPCPKCKKEITIPALEEKVVIHAPEDAGPKDSKGVAVLKPIERKEFTVGKLTWIACGTSILLILGVAIAVRVNGSIPSTWLLVIGSMLLAPPIVMLGYTFFRDDELEGYDGQEYWIRTAICSILFAATWLVYAGLGYYFGAKSLAEIDTTMMAVYVAVMFGLGLGVSLVTFELEVFQAFLHYATYFALCFILCMIMGLALAEPLATAKPAIGNPLPVRASSN